MSLSWRVGSLLAKSLGLSHHHISQCSEDETCEALETIGFGIQMRGSYQVTGITLGSTWHWLGSVLGISPVVTGITLAIRAIAAYQIVVSPIVLVTPSIRSALCRHHHRLVAGRDLGGIHGCGMGIY